MGGSDKRKAKERYKKRKDFKMRHRYKVITGSDKHKMFQCKKCGRIVDNGICIPPKDGCKGADGNDLKGERTVTK